MWIVSSFCGHKPRNFFLMRLIYVCNMDSISLCLRSWWLKRLHLNKTPGNIRKVIYIINSAGYLNRIYAEDVFAPYKAT